MRAANPAERGSIRRAGANVAYEIYGDQSEQTILLLPTWQILHARHWKLMIPYLSRHYRVVVYDGLGNGASDRVRDPTRYGPRHAVDDGLAVLDATDTASAVVAGVSMGGQLGLLLGALHPERIDGVVAIAPSHPWMAESELRDQAEVAMFEPVVDPVGWEKYNLHHWRQDWPDFVDFFLGECCSDPHSTKLFDDTTGWALETDGDVIAAAGVGGGPTLDFEQVVVGLAEMPMPVRIVHGTGDRVQPHASSVALLDRVPGAELVTLDGAGHLPNGRFPVKINHLIKEVADRVYRPETQAPLPSRPIKARKKALMLSSPIGLGHSRRDLAICNELRRLHPDLDIDWLAQDPVTRVLESAGQRIHPASRHLANESAHLESESGEHDLAVFQALRDMDEILVANFMVCDEVLAEGDYDLVIGDEAWELDFHLHENPNLKKAAYAWLTDFVGYLPMPERGDREAFVAADYNAEMIEHIARHSSIRDKAIFVGNPDDIVPDRFGPGLPLIRDWTEANYDFAGYVTGFDPAELGDRDELRRELGYRADEPLCVVSVGGSGVGSDLLRRVAAAVPAARRRVDGLRFILVTGPRIDPTSMPEVAGVEYRAYVDRLYRHLACADVAIVQGGLTTTMELTALGVPFVYVPLRNHFEQNFHVRARLENYRAGFHLDYAAFEPDHVAAVIAELIDRPQTPRPVETDGAARAAELIADLLDGART